MADAWDQFKDAGSDQWSQFKDAGASAAPKTSQALGFEQSVGNFLANAADMAGKVPGVGTVFKALSGGHTLTDSTAALRNPAHAPNETPGAWGAVAGNLLETAPLAFAGPLVGGAAMGGLSSEQKDTQGNFVTPSASNVALNTGLGAVAGKATDYGLGKLQNALLPKLAPAVQALRDAKIPLTIGQTLGGAVKSAEDKMTSWPVVGTAIKAAQDKAVVGLNRAALNRALAPVGETLPADVPVGREGVGYVESKIGQKYEDLLPKLSAKSDPQFVSDMQGVIENAKNTLPDAQYNQFQKIVQSQIGGKAPTGEFDGPTLQGINSELGAHASGYGSDPSYDNRQLGDAIGQVRSALSDLTKRSNPDQASALKAADTAWANFARVRRAASAVGAKDGVFSAPQLANAVKASDKSAGKGAYARGSALMQDLSDPANSVMPSRVPDSGTAGRLLSLAMLKNPAMAVPGLAAGAVYSGPGQAAMRGLFGGGASRLAGAARLPLSFSAPLVIPPLINPLSPSGN